MLKDYFEVPNKPAIKSGNVLSCDFTDHETFIPQPLDFTRGTLATYVDCNGLIKTSGVSDTELVTNGDFATDSDWTKGTGWIINNGKAINTGGANFSDLTQSNTDITIGKTYKITYTISDYTSGSIKFIMNNNSAAGAERNANGTYTDYISALSQGYSFRTQGSGFIGKIDNVSVKEVDVNTPRIDYTTEIGKAKELQKPSLLLEPQSTNLVTFSEDFNSSLYTETNITVTSDSIISPDGTKNASMLTDDSTNGQHRLTTSALFTADGNNRCWSIFVKKGTSRYCAFNHVSGFTSAVNTIVFDFDTATYTATGTTAYMDEVFPPQNYGNGWYKISFRSDINSNSYTKLNIGLSSGPTYNDASYAGTGDTMYIWGGQVEQQNYATSYIPTAGATVTRNGEICRNAGSAPVFNSEEGTFYAEIAALADDFTSREMTLNGGNTSNRLVLSFNANNQIRVDYTVSSSLQVRFNRAADMTKFNKVAFKYKVNDFKLYLNGSLSGTDTSGSVPAAGTFNNFDFSNGSNNFNFYGRIKEIKAFRRTLTDSEMAELTNNIV